MKGNIGLQETTYFEYACRKRLRDNKSSVNGMDTSFGRGDSSHNDSLPSDQDGAAEPQDRHQSKVALS